MRDEREADELVEDYLLVPDPRGRVVLHRGVDNLQAAVAPIGLVLADLSDWNSAREDGVVNELLESVL